MAPLRLNKLRTFKLRMLDLQQDDVQILEQLKPSQSLSVTIYMTDQLVARMLLAMQNLTSLTLVGPDSTSHAFQPQPRLRVLALGLLCIGPIELDLLVQNYSSLKTLCLHDVQGLQFSPDTLCTIFCGCGI